MMTAWPRGPCSGGHPRWWPFPTRQWGPRQATHRQRSLYRMILLPPGGGKWNLPHTHTVWRFAGLYSLTFSSQRGNLALELTDDFKIYLNKCGGQHRLLANCIIGLRPSCFGDFPTHSESYPGNPSCSALPRSRRVFTWLDLNLAAPLVYSLTCSAICS